MPSLRRGLLNQYIAAFSACLSVLLSGACYGWVTPLVTQLTGADSEIPMTAAEEAWVISIIELGNLASPLPAGALANRLGRKPVILASGPLHLISWLLVLRFRTALWLGAARVLQGVAMGLAFTAAPVYLGEIAGDSSRGAVTSMFFAAFWLGFLVEFAVGPYVSFTTFTWFTLAMSLPFVALFVWQPETPHFLVMKGNREAAARALEHFRDADAGQIEAEMRQIEESVKAGERGNDFKELISTPADRKALALLMAGTAVRILSGTGSILVYATEIFELTSGYLAIPPNVITVILGIIMFAGSCVGSVASDTLGRRPLLLISCVGSFVCQLSAGTFYYLLLETDVPVAKYGWFAPSIILIYSGLCTAGLYPVCSSYTSELFNTNTRGYASCLSSLNVTLFSFIMLVTFLPVTEYFGVYTNFYIYSAVTFVGSIYFFICAPETKGKSFSQIRRELCNSCE